MSNGNRTVYVEGDLGNPTDLVVWDATTDTKIDVVEFQYAALVGTSTQTAQLREAGSSGYEKVDVLPCPRILKPGDRVFRFRVEQLQGQANGMPPTEDVVVEAGCLEVQRNGGLRTSPHRSWHGRQVTDRRMIQTAQDSKGFLSTIVRRAVIHAAGKIAEQVADDFVAGGGLEPALRRAGVRPGGVAASPYPIFTTMPPGAKYIPPIAGTVARAKTLAEHLKRGNECEECWGTGFWKGSGKPCSKGCKKP